MTPAQAELLSRYRRVVADMQRDMDAFQERGMKLLDGGDQDVTEEHMAKMAERIAELEALIEKHDPDGFTVLR